mgnify:CR=1 FL=1
MLDGQNLPALSKALDVPYRTLWGWINESEENRQRYDEAREEQIKEFTIHQKLTPRPKVNNQAVTCNGSLISVPFPLLKFSYLKSKS